MKTHAPRASAATPLVHLQLLAVQVFFASFGVAGKIALRQIPSVALAAMRVSTAALVFFVVWLCTRRERVAAGDLLRIAVYAMFGVTANQLLFLAGLHRTSATSAVVLSASIPVFTVGIALALRRERASGWKLAGLLLALAGAILAALSRPGAAAGATAPSEALLGNTLITLNSLCYAVYLVLSRDLLSRLHPLTVVTFTFLFGALGIDGFMLAASAAHALPFSPLAFAATIPELLPATLGAVAWIVAFPTVGAYLLNALALRVVPASLVAVYVYVQPTFGAIFAAVVLGERPSPLLAVAAVAIFAGIALANRTRSS